MIHGAITIGELTFLSGSFSRLRGSMQGFFLGFTKISENALYLKDYFEFIDFKVVKPKENLMPVPLKIIKGFRFEHVGFTYQGSEHEILTDLNFDIQTGETMDIVGENGAGETKINK